MHFWKLLLFRVQTWRDSSVAFSIAMGLEFACLFILNHLKKKMKESSSDESTQLFDQGLGDFTHIEAYDTLSRFGFYGRKLYMFHVTIEFVPYMATYTCFYSLMMSNAISLTIQNNRHWLQYISLVPFLMVVLDIIKNVCILTMVLSFPAIVPEYITSVLSIVIKSKWIVDISFLCVFIVLLLAGIPKLCGLETGDDDDDDDKEKQNNINKKNWKTAGVEMTDEMIQKRCDEAFELRKSKLEQKQQHNNHNNKNNNKKKKN